jgi:hypothetical protein
MEGVLSCKKDVIKCVKKITIENFLRENNFLLFNSLWSKLIKKPAQIQHVTIMLKDCSLTIIILWMDTMWRCFESKSIAMFDSQLLFVELFDSSVYTDEFWLNLTFVALQI